MRLRGPNPIVRASKELADKARRLADVYRRTGKKKDDDAWSAALYEVKDLQKAFSYAIPTSAAVEALVSLSPIVEIGAGGGYWAMVLRNNGADVVAYDIRPYCNRYVNACWSEVLVGDTSEASGHRDRTLLIVWPPPAPMGLGALKAHGGQWAVVVGIEETELRGPSPITGTPTMWKYLRENYSLVDEIELPGLGPREWALWSSAYVYRRIR